MRLRDHALPLTRQEPPLDLNDNHIDETELARLGIKRLASDRFLWGDHRYGNAREAIAAARRGDRK